MPDRRVLVVGTTPDYVDYICGRYPGRALFLTDSAVRAGSTYASPEPTSEIVLALKSIDECRRRLAAHLECHGITLSGITCYDCEWLGLTSILARSLGLPYVSESAVVAARDKSRSRQLWQESGVRCPRFRLVDRVGEALAFAQGIAAPVVLKPLTGSGSELTFRCDCPDEVRRAFATVESGLSLRRHLPMYASLHGESDPGASTRVLVEECVVGEEYSADFIVERSQIVRLAGKVRGQGMPFGTTRAYRVPGVLPARLDRDNLGALLHSAAAALGIDRGICMVDLMVTASEVVFLEMTPRIGGDCLPPLVRRSCGLDTIGMALDYAESRPIAIPSVAAWEPLVGMRLFASSGGVLARIDATAVVADRRVREVYLKRSAGHVVTLPPEDYDSWLLGHVIFRPDPDPVVEMQCDEIASRMLLEMEPHRHERRRPELRAETSGSAQASIARS